jgi:DNA-binding NarL/FixJ family response regulator
MRLNPMQNRQPNQPSNEATMPTPTRIAIIDDHEMFIQGVSAIIQAHEDYVVVGAAQNVASALALAEQERFDVALLDINLPSSVAQITNGIDLCKALLKRSPDLRVIGLSMHIEPHFVRSMLQAGAAGYVLKNADKNELFTALRTVAGGQAFVSPAAASALALHTQNTLNTSAEGISEILSEREIEIVRLIASGANSKDIAEKLFLSAATVETHRKRILRKAGAANTAELIKFAVKSGLV